MRFRMLTTATVLVLMTQVANAQSTQLKVLASNGMKAVMEELRPRLQRDVGRPLAMEFNTSVATRQR